MLQMHEKHHKTAGGEDRKPDEIGILYWVLNFFRVRFNFFSHGDVW